jgi:hypothetical protein
MLFLLNERVCDCIRVFHPVLVLVSLFAVGWEKIGWYFFMRVKVYIDCVCAYIYIYIYIYIVIVPPCLVPGCK